MLVVIFSLIYCFSFKNPYARFLASFWVLSVFLYSYAAVFQIMFEGRYSEFAAPFLFFTSFSIIFTILGFVFGEKKILFAYKSNSLKEKYRIPFNSSLFIAILILLVLNIQFLSDTPDLKNLFTLARYEIITEQDTPNLIVGVLSLFVAGYLSALFSDLSSIKRKKIIKKDNSFFVIGIPTKLNISKALYISIGILLASFSVFLLARGDRNPLLILFVPFLAAKFKIEEIKPKFIILIFLLGFLIAQLFDVIRAISIVGFINNVAGIETDQELNVSISSLLYNSGEFLTPLKTFNTYLNNNFDFDSYINNPPGYSYTIGVLFNFLQTFGLADENQTIAGSFSKVFADEGMGIGFSHQLEAFINFRWIGIIIPYFPLGLLLGRLSSLSFFKKGIFWISTYYLSFPIIVNLQRIDFAVSSKLFVYSFLGIFVYCLINKKLPFK